MNPTAYSYNAALHCVDCTSRAAHANAFRRHPPLSVQSDANGIADDMRDREGNPITAAFDVAGYCDDCGMAYGNAEPVMRVLSVDAWRDGSGWTWNNWHARGFVPFAWRDLQPRALLRMLRARGCYSLPAPGHARVEDDGHNLVVCLRGTGEPLLALVYGEVP